MYKLKIFYNKKDLINFLKENKIKDYKYKKYILNFKNKLINNYFLSYK
jgi:hypothetical protein